MCYFDQTLWACGYWKWGNFRQQCNKEYRTGETCGLKLVFETIPMPESCKLCDQMTKKRRRMNKMMGDIARWHREGNRWATIEKTQRDVMELKEQLDDLEAKHTEKTRCLTGFG